MYSANGIFSRYRFTPFAWADQNYNKKIVYWYIKVTKFIAYTKCSDVDTIHKIQFFFLKKKPSNLYDFNFKVSRARNRKRGKQFMKTIK